MGTCCYTPTKREFLWWYWLLLLSIVGIPMLAAVLYVARAKGDDEPTKRARGERAAWIFWLGTVLVACAFPIVLGGLFNIVPQYPPVEQEVRTSRRAVYHRPVEGWHGYWALAAELLITLGAANWANESVRKRPWYGRVPVLVGCVAVYFVVLLVFDLVLPFLVLNAMQFFICMLPAHCWGQFKDRPEKREAWRSLLALVVAVPLFFLVSYYGEDVVEHAGNAYYSLYVEPGP